MRNPWGWACGAFLTMVAATWILILPVADTPASPSGDVKQPKLVVLVVFDQMRGDYLQKWQPLFGAGGFRRLQTDGAWFTNCHYPYAYTLTAAGHTSLVTGTTPSKHGIIANEWYDRANGESVASVQPPPEEIAKGTGPYRRKSETVGDVLMRVLKGRVTSMSIKERAAVLMAALRANLCLWFNPTSGNFATSPYYYTEGHAWISKFNKERYADQWLDKNWDRFDKKIDYVKHSGPDDFKSEGTGYLQGQTFPHPFKFADTNDEKVNKQNYYDAVTCSPMGNDLLLEFAMNAIAHEKLGQADTVDLLCIGFTSNDYIGHTWGPDSQEVLDVTLRSDALMKKLLDLLDAKVGKGNYYLAMSADHGVCPLPEFAKEENRKADRIAPELLTSLAEEFLNKKYLPAGAKAPWFIVPRRMNTWVYFNHETLKELKLKQADVERSLADWFSAQPGIERAFTRTEMEADAKDASELHRMVRRSYYAECSGDVMVIAKPYHIFSPPNLSDNPTKYPNYRATHGMPHAYDTHVPLLVMGPRIEPGTRDQRIAPQSMASILATALGVPAPKDATYPVPDGLFKK